MRPAISGPFFWQLLEDLVAPVDEMVKIHDVLMRSPAMNDQTGRTALAKLNYVSGETASEAQARLVTYHLLYLSNVARMGQRGTLIPDSMLDPLRRWNTLSLVNSTRSSCGMKRIDARAKLSVHDGEFDDFFVPPEDTNVIKSFEISPNETYSVSYCRKTVANVTPSLLSTDSHGAGQLLREMVDKSQPTSSSVIHLGPDFYDSAKETWLHRAIDHQETFALTSPTTTSEGTTPWTINQPGYNGYLNKCAQCKWCFMNIPHISSSEVGIERVNVSHNKTLQEYADQMLMALTVLMPCIDCNFHFGASRRYQHFINVGNRTVSLYQLDTTTSSDSTSHDSQKNVGTISAASSSELSSSADREWVDEQRANMDAVAQTVIKMSLFAASSVASKMRATPEKKPAGALSIRKGGKVVSATSSPSETQSTDSLGHAQSLERHISKMARLYDTQEGGCPKLMAYVVACWQKLKPIPLENLKSVLSGESTPSEMYPVGHIIRQYLARIEMKEYDAAMWNTVGSLIFPPLSTPCQSNMKYLWTLHNFVNARSGKPQFGWQDFASKRLCFGSSSASLTSVWFTIISVALSLKSFHYKFGTNRTAVNSFESPAQRKYYLHRNAEFIKQFEKPLDELCQHLYEQLFGLMKEVAPKVYTDVILDELKEKNEGKYPSPKLKAEMYEEFTFDQKLTWNRITSHIQEIQAQIDIAKHMREELNRQGKEDDLSWVRFGTPNAAMMALNSFLEAMTALSAAHKSYRTLVRFIWPIPDQYAWRPEDFLIDNMWRWHMRFDSICSLVQDTLLSTSVEIKSAGDGVAGVDSRNWTSMQARLDLYMQFIKEFRIASERPFDEDWRMPEAWMFQFKTAFEMRIMAETGDLGGSIMPTIQLDE